MINQNESPHSKSSYGYSQTTNQLKKSGINEYPLNIKTTLS